MPKWMLVFREVLESAAEAGLGERTSQDDATTSMFAKAGAYLLLATFMWNGAVRIRSIAVVYSLYRMYLRRVVLEIVLRAFMMYALSVHRCLSLCSPCMRSAQMPTASGA